MAVEIEEVERKESVTVVYAYDPRRTAHPAHDSARQRWQDHQGTRRSKLAATSMPPRYCIDLDLKVKKVSPGWRSDKKFLGAAGVIITNVVH